jgi:hypothetical protein
MLVLNMKVHSSVIVLEKWVKIKPEFGSGIKDGRIPIRDTKKLSDPGSGINIPDPQNCYQVSISDTGTYRHLTSFLGSGTGTVILTILFGTGTGTTST